jgi:hypothetical protein
MYEAENNGRGDLQLTVQALKRKPSAHGQIKLHNKQQHLQSKIKMFNKMGSQFLEGIETDGIAFTGKAVEDDTKL